MRAPALTWASCSGVRFKAAAVDKARETLATRSSPLAEAGSEQPGHSLRLVDQLAPAYPHDVPTGERELEVAAAILLELTRRVVGRALVGLDDQPMSRPLEIDLVDPAGLSA
jgi:hypothetical protein